MTFSGAAVARWIAPFLTVAAVAAVGAVSAPVHSADTPAVRLASDANPLAGMPFYVNPQSKGMRAAQGNPDPLLAAVVNTPTAYWMDHISTPAVDAKYIATAQAAGTMPILALYGIPNRDCGSYAAGPWARCRAYGRVPCRRKPGAELALPSKSAGQRSLASSLPSSFTFR